MHLSGVPCAVSTYALALCSKQGKDACQHPTVSMCWGEMVDPFLSSFYGQGKRQYRDSGTFTGLSVDRCQAREVTSSAFVS